MSGTLLATPMVSSAEEAGNNSTTSSTNTSESTAGTGSTATASENTTGTGSAVVSAASAGTSSPATGTNNTTASAVAAGTSSTVVTVPETPVDPSTTLPNNVDTVIPSDEMKGTETESAIWGRHIEYDPFLGIPETAPIGADETEIKVSISPEESKGEETLSPT